MTLGEQKKERDRLAADAGANRQYEMKLFSAFSEVVRGVLGDDDECDRVVKKIPHRVCKDQSVGLISDITRRVCDPCQLPFERGEVLSDNRKSVALILESPNKLEYRRSGNEWIPVGPACGCTGCRIARNWHDIFGSRFDDRELVLINAVEFQCSLAFAGDYNKNKDRIVRECLENSVLKNRLEYRIKKIRTDSTIFINACTGDFEDCSSSHFKVSAILESLQIQALDLSHPNSWRCCRNVATQKKRVEAHWNPEANQFVK